MDMNPQFAERLQRAYYIWFTTVRDDGMPQPTPVWFIHENDTYLIYTMPDSHKVRNLRANSLVALSYNESDDAGDYLVIMGEAKIDRHAPPALQNAAYVEKYRQGFIDIKMTPEEFSRDFSTAIRVVPLRVRGE